MKKVLIMFLALLMIAGCSTSDKSTDKAEGTAAEETAAPLGIDVPFEFDGFEIMFSNPRVQQEVIMEKATEKEVVVFDVTFTNNNEETKSFPYYELAVFDPTGTEVDKPIFTQSDNSLVDYAMKELRNGASNTAEYFVYYNGDGTYIVEFKPLFTDKGKIEFNVEITK